MRRIVLLVGLLAGMMLSSVPEALAAPDKPVTPTSRARAESALREVQDLRAGRGVRTGRELTLALVDLARRKAALSTADRRKANGILARPTDGLADEYGDGYTVAEATPHCTTNFCVHYVPTTADAPALTDTTPPNGVPDYVERMATEFEFVHTVENGTLGWVEPKSDGTMGTDTGKTDVYITDTDGEYFGYAAPEENAISSYGYLVMDDDYAEFAPTDPLVALQVTAAHEYNHVLQFTYDSWQDIWMFEATAVWVEEHVYPAANDYLNYVSAWTPCTAVPLTSADPPGTSCDLKLYGSGVWNHWLDSRYGSDEIRRAWELSDVTSPEPHFAPDAYDESVAAEGGAGFGDEFGRFAAAVAEWRTPASSFPDHASYPDVSRTGTPMTVNGGARAVALDHTTFALIDVTPDASQPSIELHADVPAGLDATLALVGRTGPDPAAGAVTSSAQRLPSGGAGTVTLANPGGFGRITAVLVNADSSQSGFNGATGDWIWSRDGQVFQNVRITPPTPVVAVPAAALKLTSRLALRSPQRLRTALRRGVLARVRCNQACRVRVELRLDRRTARRLHIKRVVGTRVVILKRAGVRSVRVKLSRRARAKLRKRRTVRLTAVMRATRGGTSARVRTGRVTLRR